MMMVSKIQEAFAHLIKIILHLNKNSFLPTDDEELGEELIEAKNARELNEKQLSCG